MDAIEKRARELLATEWSKMDGCGGHVAEGIRRGADLPVDIPAIRAIIAALTPPEGYVLVPVEPTSEMQDAVESMKMPHALLRTGVRIADFHERYAAMLAARPEVGQ